MLRIHVSGMDLSRVRMAVRPDAMWETILSFHRLRDRRGSTVFGKWRTESRARLNGEGRLLAALVPPRGYFPDFLTPSQEGAEPFGLEVGIEALRDTPGGRLRSELALLAGNDRSWERERERPRGCVGRSSGCSAAAHGLARSQCSSSGRDWRYVRAPSSC